MSALADRIRGIVATSRVPQGQPPDEAQGQPSTVAQGEPSNVAQGFSPANDVAQGQPSNVAQGQPSNVAQGFSPAKDVARGQPSNVAQGFSPANDVAHGQGSTVAQGFSPAIAADIATLLGGAWRPIGSGSCFVVERRWERSALHGRERIGVLSDRLHNASGEAPLFTGGSPARPPFVFFDLETTGLNGGAGTLAFLVGCGWFDDCGAFVTRQFLLARHADERMLLEAVAGELARAGALVSFNGKSFDAPLLEGRYLFHRVPWRGREMPHVDVLHPARRFWKPVARPARADSGYAFDPFVTRTFMPMSESACSLQALEHQLVGARRTGDVPGFEIPGRYFQFVRSGDAAPLEAVLEHNRLDLLTLAALTARLLDMARRGPESIGDPREALALGHVYLRGGLEERARASFQRALDRCRSPRGAYDPIRIDVLRALALACRRAGRHDEAAGRWRELAEMRGCPPAIVREATEALAIHHEHRVRDLHMARQFALGTLAAATGGPRPSIVEAVRHRLARIERKMGELPEAGRLLD